MLPLDPKQKGGFMLSALLIAENGGSNDLKWLVQFCLWIARSLILAIFCGFGILKMVKGHSEENPQMKSEGLEMIAMGAFIFAGTFAVEAAF